METCAIVGHHPTRFKFKYNEKNNGCKRLKKRLKEQFSSLYEKGVRKFYISGTLGVDLWSGEILLRMKEQPEYADLQIVLVIPFAGYDRDWDERSKRRLAFLGKHSEVLVMSGEANAECYKRKNQYILEHMECLLAVYDNNRTMRNSVGQIVRAAEKKRIPIILVHPDSAAITYE